MKPAAVKRKTIARWTTGTTNFHAVSRFYQESNVSSNVIDLVARTIFIAYRYASWKSHSSFI